MAAAACVVAMVRRQQEGTTGSEMRCEILGREETTQGRKDIEFDLEDLCEGEIWDQDPAVGNSAMGWWVWAGFGGATLITSHNNRIAGDK